MIKELMFAYRLLVRENEELKKEIKKVSVKNFRLLRNNRDANARNIKYCAIIRRLENERN